jgi:hypothetical protein
MSRFNDSDDPRREFLLTLLAAGLLSATGSGRAWAASLLGKRPGKLPPGQSFYDLDGDVRVNGKPAAPETVIGANDTVETGKGARAIFVVGQDAMLLREGSKLTLAGTREGSVVQTLTLLAGKLLSVFGKTEHRVRTTTAVVGIRGTGVYVEADPEQTYFCTCYGTVDMTAVRDPGSRERIVSEHHDKPRYILAKAAAGQALRPAPFINHTDPELALIEALVGRTVPFVFSDKDYVAPRRDY